MGQLVRSQRAKGRPSHPQPPSPSKCRGGPRGSGLRVRGHAPFGNTTGSCWACPRDVHYGLDPPRHARAGRLTVHKPTVECGRTVLHVAPSSVGPTGVLLLSEHWSPRVPVTDRRLSVLHKPRARPRRRRTPSGWCWATLIRPPRLGRPISRPRSLVPARSPSRKGFPRSRSRIWQPSRLGPQRPVTRRGCCMVRPPLPDQSAAPPGSGTLSPGPGWRGWDCTAGAVGLLLLFFFRLRRGRLRFHSLLRAPAGRARFCEPMGAGKPTFPQPGGPSGQASRLRQSLCTPQGRSPGV